MNLYLIVVVDNFFDILEYRLSDNDTLLNMLNKKIPKDMREEYTMEFTYPADNPSYWKYKAKTCFHYFTHIQTSLYSGISIPNSSNAL